MRFSWFLPVLEEKPPEELLLGKGCKVGLCPLLQAASLQILEAGTVTFSLARLPGRRFTSTLDTGNTLRDELKSGNGTEVPVEAQTRGAQRWDARYHPGSQGKTFFGVFGNVNQQLKWEERCEKLKAAGLPPCAN
jgi:hypothetical protein